MAKAQKGKGKALATANPPTEAAIPSAETTTTGEMEENDLLALAISITSSAHCLAPLNSNSKLAQEAKRVLKASFDRGTQSHSLEQVLH